MADEKHIEIPKLDVETWNIWHNANYRGFANLQRASFRCADLAGVNLTGARLQDADLRYADLRGADLTGVRLERTNLCGAILASVTGLTQQQMHFAEGNQSTNLPDGVEHPDHCFHTNKNLNAILSPCATF